jgi:preprotein translocase subunit YajC
MIKNKIKSTRDLHNQTGNLYSIGLVSYAFAQSSAGVQQKQPSAMASFLPLILIFAVFYFLLIRPQKKQAQQQQVMINSLKKGDNIVTSGGIHARVTALKGKDIEVEIAPNTRVMLNKQAVTKNISDSEDQGSSEQEPEKAGNK